MGVLEMVSMKHYGDKVMNEYKERFGSHAIEKKQYPLKIIRAINLIAQEIREKRLEISRIDQIPGMTPGIKKEIIKLI